MTNRQPWHRQEGETSKAYNAFVIYRDMGPGRSLEKVCQNLSKRPHYITILKEWSSRHGWVARCLAHDEDMADRRRKAQAEAIERMAERQAQQGMAFQQVATSHFMDPATKKLRTQLDKDADAIRAMEVGVKIERTARGEPTEIVDVRLVEQWTQEIAGVFVEVNSEPDPDRRTALFAEKADEVVKRLVSGGKKESIE